MTNSTEENILGTEKIGRLMAKFSIPAVISMVVSSIYNLVDQIFIGWSEVGFLGNGATNVAFPFTTLVLSIALMISAGTAANISLNLGRKNQERAERTLAQGFFLSAVAGIVVCVIGQCFLEPLLWVFGATDKLISLALDYSRIILIGFPFVTMGVMMGDFIRADGSPRYAMVAMVSGAIVNTILDPLFLFVFHWGIQGAALATILGQILTFAISLAYMFRRCKTVQLRRAFTRPQWSVARHIFSIGLSAFITQAAILVVQVSVNNVVKIYGVQSVYGAEIPLTCIGIVMKVQQIMISFILGTCNGAQPIFGYNYGAKKYRRVRQLTYATLATVLVIGFAGWFVFQTFPEQVMSIFGQEDNPLYQEFAVIAIQTISRFIFVMGVQMLSSVYYQAVGKPVKAIILALSRQILFMVPMLFILPRFFGLTGVLYAFNVSDLCSLALSAILLVFELRGLNKLVAREGPETV